MKAALNNKLHVTKASGKQAMFLPGKIIHSFKRSGVDEAALCQLLQQPDLLKTTGMDAKRKEQLITEIKGLCLKNQSMYQQ